MTDPRPILGTIARRITPKATTAETEEWWSLALRVGSLLDEDEASSGQEREAARRLIWAVSGVVRASRHSGQPDHRKMQAALTDLCDLITQRTLEPTLRHRNVEGCDNTMRY